MSQNNRYMAVSVTDTKADTKRPKVGGQSRGTGVQDASVAALERELAIYKRDSGIEMEELRAKVNNMPKGGGAGEPGKDGVGIESVEQTVVSEESGGENKIEITLTDGQKTEVVIRNGKDGEGGGEGGNVTPESIGAVQSKAHDTIGTNTTIADTICNYAAKGVYSGQFQAADNVSDNPEPNLAFAIEFVNAGGDTVCIRAHKLYTDIVYIRQINIASGQYMSNWAMFYSTGNKPTAADIGAAERNSTHLSETADLNTITDEGEYYYGWWQETIQNSPVHSAFHLSVNRISADEVSQTYTQYTGGENDVWFRQSNNGKTSWSAWKKIATTDYAVNKAGDTIKGKLYTTATNGALGSATDDSAIRIDGGTSYDKGAFLTLYGKDNAGTSGGFQLVASNNDSTRKELRGWPDGTLNWGGNAIYHTGNKPTVEDVGAFGQSNVTNWTGTDLNDFKSFGAIICTTAKANSPKNASPYATVWNIAGFGSSYMIQHYFDVVSQVVHYRGYIDGKWKEWQRIATTDYIDEQILKGEW